METVAIIEEETVIDKGIKTADEFLFLYYILLGRYQQTWWLRGGRPMVVDHVYLKKVVDYVTNVQHDPFSIFLSSHCSHCRPQNKK